MGKRLGRRRRRPAPRRGGAERSEVEALRDGVRSGAGRNRAEERTRAVLELVSGNASVEGIARRFGMRTATGENWRDPALQGIEEATRQQTGTPAREHLRERDPASLEKTIARSAFKRELSERALNERPSQLGTS